ncbi:MAG: O-methyltransferase [Anaerolineae bacterium]
MSTSPVWTAVDEYLDGLFVPSDPALKNALVTSAQAGLPNIHVSPAQGKLLHVLALAHKARTILEIGTLGGYSTIWLARALPVGGRVITLEINPAHAAVARENLEFAGLMDRVDLRIGTAIDLLPELVGVPENPFDLVFIDADKPSTPAYLAWAMRLTQPGSMIIIDNVIRKGAVADPNSEDANVQGVQQALADLARDPRVVASAAQTVGSKGYDGFALALVVGT